jgi:lysophospholipid acyltransferase (LPLAT)-like uncharacterized protein
LSCWLTRRLGPALIYAWFLTIRCREDDRSRQVRRNAKARRRIYAFWHAHQLGALVSYRRQGGRVLISRSRDGEYAAILAEQFGHVVVRGSSSRDGAAGARALIHAAQQGHPVAVTPDGPRGPRHVVQKGVLAIAARTGYPVAPVAVGYSDYWELRSWDRFRIPKPFSVAFAVMAPPIHVPPGSTDQDLAELAERLRRVLIETEEEADRLARSAAGRS